MFPSSGSLLKVAVCDVLVDMQIFGVGGKEVVRGILSVGLPAMMIEEMFLYVRSKMKNERFRGRSLCSFICF